MPINETNFFEQIEVQNDEERYKSAIHESGHALLAMLHDSRCVLHSISLKQNNRSFGRIADTSLSEPYIETEDDILHDIIVGLGGGVAEQIFGLPEPCDITIDMMDSSYWEVFSKDEQLINRFASKFKEASSGKPPTSAPPILFSSTFLIIFFKLK